MRNIPMKRRRKNITDYKGRISMLKSEIPRVTFRKTNRYVIGAFIISEESQDYIKEMVNSKELIKHGWPDSYSIKNLPACYLVGLLLGKKIQKNQKVKDVILDIGLMRNISKSRTYAFAKGLKDAKVDIKCSEETFPDETRLSGKHINSKIEEIFNKVKNNILK